MRFWLRGCSLISGLPELTEGVCFDESGKVKAAGLPCLMRLTSCDGTLSGMRTVPAGGEIPDGMNKRRYRKDGQEDLVPTEVRLFVWWW